MPRARKPTRSQVVPCLISRNVNLGSEQGPIHAQKMQIVPVGVAIGHNTWTTKSTGIILTFKVVLKMLTACRTM